MVLYSLFLLLLYIIGAGFASNAFVHLIFADHPHNTYEVLWMLIASIFLIASHYSMLDYGKKKTYLSKPLAITLCLIDVFGFVYPFAFATVILLRVSFLNYVKSIFAFTSFSIAYCLLAVFLIFRSYCCFYFFKSRRDNSDRDNKTGDGTVS